MRDTLQPRPRPRHEQRKISSKLELRLRRFYIGPFAHERSATRFPIYTTHLRLMFQWIAVGQQTLILYYVVIYEQILEWKHSLSLSISLSFSHENIPVNISSKEQHKQHLRDFIPENRLCALHSRVYLNLLLFKFMFTNLNEFVIHTEILLLSIL